MHLGILLICLLAFALRVYAIDRQDIWGDEAFSIWLSSQPLPQVVAGGADTHPPLYPFLLFGWLRLAGESPLSTRTLSAAIGTLIVPVLYALGVRVSGQRPSLLAALLAAVSPALVYYSQETRMYGLATLLSAASVYWALRAFRRPNSGGSWLAYLASTAGAVYTHYYAFFVVLAENLVIVAALIRRRQWPALWRWLAVQAALVVAYLPWIAVQRQFLSGKASARFEEWGLPAAVSIVHETLAALGAGLAVSPAAGTTIALLCLVAVIPGLVFLARQRRAESGVILAYLLVPILLAWAVDPIMPFFYARYLLLIAPAFYLVAACGVLAWRRLWPPLALAVAAVLLLASSYGLVAYYTDDAYLKGRYGQMMAYLQANAQPGDGLVLANTLQRPLFDYYRPDGLPAYFFPQHGVPLEDPRTDQELSTIAARHPRLWLVRFGNPAEYDPNATLTGWLATHGSQAYSGGWVDSDLALYVMAPANAGSELQYPLRLNLGDSIRLLGYDLGSQAAAPGDALLLTLYWQALQPIAERYTVFTHPLDASDRVVAQVDSEPQGGSLPTDRWVAGQTIPDNYALTIPAGLPPGDYALEVGIYLLETLQRLPVRNPDTGATLGDRVLLGAIEVKAQ